MSLKNENYYTVQAWMRSELDLSGLELSVYAIIYGFSQYQGHYFNGSVAYLMEWTGASRSGIMKTLASLVEKGLITKEESNPTNKYYANRQTKECLSSEPVHSVDNTCTLSSQPLSTEYTSTGLLSRQNNINNNIDNKYNITKQYYEMTEEVISYLNKVCGTKFRSSTAANRKLVKARILEGFTLDDFKKVIDKKYLDWGKSPCRFSNGQMSDDYLRPQTLFGDKFESYLNEKVSIKNHSESVSNPILEESSYMEF